VLKNSKYRRLCFVNTGDSIRSDIVEKAEELNYHVIQAETAHAEGELIQYFHTYKGFSLVGMGCDKPHCQECATLLASYLKTDTLYTDTTVSDAVFTKYNMPDPLQQATGSKKRPRDEQGWQVKKKQRKNPQYMTLRPTGNPGNKTR
jgi:hypothetical protein